MCNLPGAVCKHARLTMHGNHGQVAFPIWKTSNATNHSPCHPRIENGAAHPASSHYLSPEAIFNASRA